MTLYKRLAKIFLYGFVGLSLALILPLYAVLGTATGSQWLVTKISEYLPQQVSFNRYQGALLSDFQFDELKIDTDSFSLHSQKLSVQWSPLELFGGTVRIDAITVNDAEAWIRANDEQNNTATGAAPWPELRLPLDLVLAQLRIDDVMLHLPEQPAQSFGVTGGVALERDGQLAINKLDITHNYATVQLDARVGLNSNKSIHVESNIFIRVPDYPETQILLSVSGDADQLQGTLATQKAIESKTRFTLDALLQDLSFKSTTQIAKSELQPWVSAFSLSGIETGSLKGEIKAEGSLTNIQVKPKLDLSVNEQVAQLSGEIKYIDNQIEFAPLKASTEGLVKSNVEIAGTVALSAEPQFDLNVTSSEVSAQSIKAATLSDLNMQIVGALHNLKVTPNFVIEPINQNAIDISAEILLADNVLDISQLTMTQNSNQVSGTARANLDNLSLTTDLQGQWKSEPIKLAADVRFESPYLFIEQLDLNWRDNTLSATGDLRPGSAINLTLNARDLSDLPVPNISLAGSLSGKGMLSGSIDAPSLAMKIESNSIQIDESVLEDLFLDFSGDLSEQTTQIKVSYRDIDLSINTATALTEDRLAATIKQFSIRQENVGRFKLREPSDVVYHFRDQRLSLSKLCLTQRQELICAEAINKNQQLQASVSITALPLALIEPFIPLSDLVISGTLSGEVDANVKLDSSIEIASLTGQFGIDELRIEQNEEHVNFDTAKLRLNKSTSDKLVGVTLNLNSIDTGADINADLGIAANLSQPSIEGKITANLDDLSIIQTFTNQVAQIDGSLNAQATLDTRNQQLLITPNATVKIANALIGRTGTSISDTVISVSGRPSSSELQIKGRGNVGDGPFDLNGDFDLQGFTGQLALTGDSLVVMDSPRIRLIASPDLNLNIGENVIELTGEVNIPNANITPPDLSSTVTPSPDVVVVQRQQGNTQSRSLKTDLKITLGDDVRVDAYGFKGRLEGALNVVQTGQSVPIGNGTISVASGDYEIYGQKLTIDRGQFIFNGGPLSNPALNLRVTRSLSEVTDGPNSVGARVLGTLNRPELDLFSDPTMPDASVLSYLLFGRGPSSNSESQNLELQAALLVGGKTTGALTQSLKETFSLDEVAIDSETSDVNDTSLYIGKYISPNLYIKYGIGLIESTSSFYLRYRFTDNLWFESTSSTESQGADIIYSIEK
ncbi:translocation/assembly module TamB domain-containing protein [Idiomarina sp. UBA3162]|uniref:translocation/assembly module TamB domain-containing protein n=1 Tax=Idiomarina sp. UBA3162 TaxID=1946641 RepID=UPI0025BE06F2|nr:translocation/assembly module TamB domain-containing protein [Idiomarina sp. UBA3162]|tara:strand:+ start:2804 stop:6358 length:3555 start_codon:yes stop_codon:yes gene_type:complete